MRSEIDTDSAPTQIGSALSDAAFKAQPEEPTWLALRVLAAVLCEDKGCERKVPNGPSGCVNLVDFIVRRQPRVVRSTFTAEFNGLVDSAEQMLRLQCTLHPIYCGTTQSPPEDDRFVGDGSNVSTFGYLRRRSCWV